MYKLKIRFKSLSVVTITALLNVFSCPTVLGFSINFDVIVKNTKFGEVNIGTSLGMPATSPLMSEGLIGNFTTTGRTIEELESYLGQVVNEDSLHLNWLQIIRYTNIPSLNPQGIPLPMSYIDPPNGGVQFVWHDNVPWYLNESNKPLNDNRIEFPALRLEEQKRGSSLGYVDFPTGPANQIRIINFETFLIADFSDQTNKTYDVLGGFSWTATATNGITKITSLTKGATFTQN